MERETQTHLFHVKSALSLFDAATVFKLIICLCKVIDELLHSPRNWGHTHSETIILRYSCVTVRIRHTDALVTI
jgi:hypothetical protein